MQLNAGPCSSMQVRAAQCSSMQLDAARQIGPGLSSPKPSVPRSSSKAWKNRTDVRSLDSFFGIENKINRRFRSLGGSGLATTTCLSVCLVNLLVVCQTESVLSHASVLHCECECGSSLRGRGRADSMAPAGALRARARARGTGGSGGGRCWSGVLRWRRPSCRARRPGGMGGGVCARVGGGASFPPPPSLVGAGVGCSCVRTVRVRTVHPAGRPPAP